MASLGKRFSSVGYFGSECCFALLLAAEGAERQGSPERVAGYLEKIPVGADSHETSVYLLGANWLTFSNTYESIDKWLRRAGEFDQVEKLNQLSLQGKQIREQVLQLPDVRSVPIAMLRDMQNYAEDCGGQLTQSTAVIEGISAVP